MPSTFHTMAYERASQISAPDYIVAGRIIRVHSPRGCYHFLMRFVCQPIASRTRETFTTCAFGRRRVEVKVLNARCCVLRTSTCFRHCLFRLSSTCHQLKRRLLPGSCSNHVCCTTNWLVCSLVCVDQFDDGSKCAPDSARAKALMRDAYKKIDDYVHVDR